MQRKPAGLIINQPVTIKGGVIRVIDSATGDIAITAAGWIEDEKYAVRVMGVTGTMSAEFDSSVTRTGRLTLLLSNDSTGKALLANYDSGATLALGVLKYLYPVKPSTVYKLTVYSKTENAILNGTLAAGCHLHNSVGVRTSSNNIYTAAGTSSGFVKYTMTFTTGATDSYLNIILGTIFAGSANKVWYDWNSIALEEVSTITNPASVPALLYPKFTAVSSTNNIDTSLDSAGAAVNAYTPPVAISEVASNRQTFTPTKKLNTSISIWPVAKGTGDWTVTVHDSANTLVGSATIANASLTNGAMNTFAILWAWTSGAYHFHVTSTVADGTVKCGTAADLETASYLSNYQKNTTNFTVRTDTEALSYTAPTVDGWANGTIINTSTVGGVTPLTLTAGVNNVYYSSNGSSTADSATDESLQGIITQNIYTGNRSPSVNRHLSTNRLVVRDCGTALRFSPGGADNVSIPNMVNSINTVDHTFSCIVKAPFNKSGVAADAPFLMATGSSFGGAGTSYFYINLGNYLLTARIQTNGGSDVSAIYNYSKYQNKFMYVVVTVNATTKMLSLYVDGSFVHTSGASASFGTLNVNTLKFGGFSTTPLSTIIDESRQWDRLLTATEISNLYLNNIVPRDGLIGEWLFNEAAGTQALDTSGNGNHGVITGATYTTDTFQKSRLLT